MIIRQMREKEREREPTLKKRFSFSIKLSVWIIDSGEYSKVLVLSISLPMYVIPILT